MNSPWFFALTVGPLGCYLWVIAVWQSDRRPRVVRGLTDFALLIFGLSGVVIFGPIGESLTRLISSRPDPFDRLAVISALGLVACAMTPSARRRLVIYHLDPDRLVPMIGDVLCDTGGRYVKTMNGFEDIQSSRGLKLEYSRWLRCAMVEAHGVDAQGMIDQIRPLLADRFRTVTTQSSRVGYWLYGCSIAIMSIPIVATVFLQPKTREVFRVLLQQLGGG